MFRQFKLNEVQVTDHEFAVRKTLVNAYLKQFDLERLLYNFKRNAEIDTEAEPLGGWEAPDCGLRGHFVGHFLSACARFAYGDGDEMLRERTEQIVEVLQRCAQENGYLSAFPECVLDELEKEENRNVWAPYYTLHKILQGLVDCYQFLENEMALTLAVNLARYIGQRFKKLSYWKIDGILRCTKLNPVNEFGGIGDTLYQIYQITKEEEILETAQLFDRSYFIDPLSSGEDVLEDLHANTHLPMILAAMRRYEITGEEVYRNAAEQFYEYLIGRTFANGNNSSKAAHFIPDAVSEAAEHWGGYGQLGDALTGGESESCCAHNTEKIAEKLFLWNGNKKYLDHIERLKYNAVLNSASSVTGLSQYHQPMGRGKKKKFSGLYDDFWCCTGSGIEAMSEVQKDIWFKSEQSVLVNLFVSSRVHWKEKKVVIWQETEYPDGSSVRYVIQTEEPTVFRIMWKKDRLHQIRYNGSEAEVQREGDYEILERLFENGDQIEGILKSGLHFEELQGKSEKGAVLYDQILLARIGTCGHLGFNGKELEEELQRDTDGKLAFVQMLQGETQVQWKPLYRVEEEIYTVYMNRNMVQEEEHSVQVKDGSHAYKCEEE